MVKTHAATEVSMLRLGRAATRSCSSMMARLLESEERTAAGKAKGLDWSFLK
jgi:hypothetical protein